MLYSETQQRFVDVINAILHGNVQNIGEQLKNFISELSESDKALIDTPLDDSNRTLLSYCVERGLVDTANLLLSLNANPNIPDNKGNTPLFYCIKNCTDGSPNKGANINLFNELLTHHADINHPNLHGRTPIFSIIKHNCYDLIEIACKNNINIYITNKNGLTPIQYAEFKRANRDIMEYLFKYKFNQIISGRLNSHQRKEIIDHEIDSEEIDKEVLFIERPDVSTAHPPFYRRDLRIRSQSPDIVDERLLQEISSMSEYEKSLIDIPIDLNGKTLFSYAIEMGYTKSALKLIELNVNVNKPDDLGRTPITYCPRNCVDNDNFKNNMFVFFQLLKHGADINHIDSHGKTTIFYIADYDAHKLMPIAIAAGARLDILDKGENSIFKYIENKRARRVFEILDTINPNKIMGDFSIFEHDYIISQIHSILTKATEKIDVNKDKFDDNNYRLYRACMSNILRLVDFDRASIQNLRKIYFYLLENQLFPEYYTIKTDIIPLQLNAKSLDDYNKLFSSQNNIVETCIHQTFTLIGRMRQSLGLSSFSPRTGVITPVTPRLSPKDKPQGKRNMGERNSPSPILHPPHN